MVIDSTNIKDTRILLTQTPQNYNQKNYFLKELQDKIDAEWRFRPNRFDIEEEVNFGEEDYTPIQVVLQSIVGEKGEKISDDWRRIVFQKLDKKLKIGSRYRFSSEYSDNPFDPEAPEETKNIWIAVNQNRVQQTASQVVVRCNGTLGSVYKDDNGQLSYHYEPVAQTDKLQGTSFNFSNLVIDPKGSITVTAQFNKYTSQYYINQRFVIGYDQVFKVQNISKTASTSTYNPKDIGVIILYMEMDQVGEQDDLDKRIAYNGREGELVIPQEQNPDSSYSLKIDNPVPVPQFLYNDFVDFSVFLYNNNEKQEKNIKFDFYINGVSDILKYIEYEILNDNSFKIRRKRFYGGGNLIVKCYIEADESPTGEEIFQSFEINLGGLE